MGRTTDEHEILLGRLDNFFVFGYLYESERARNPDLEKLRGFAREIAAKASASINATSFQKTSKLRGTICSVMNVLQRACRKNDPEPDEPIDAAWDGLPDVFASEDLWRMHDELRDELARMFETLLSRLDRTFSAELKPYVTRQLVAATFRELRREGHFEFIGPVQVESLSAIAHQAFLVADGAGESPLTKPGQVHGFVDTYVRQANQSFQRLVSSAFIQDMVRDLFPRACRLNITLDRIYPWGALWGAPHYGSLLLEAYSALNRTGAIKDAKFSLKGQAFKKDSQDVFQHFVEWAINTAPEPRIAAAEAVVRRYYNSDDTDILIDGNFIQKHAVMAVRYDQPLPNVDRAVRQFRNYLLAQRKDYCNNAGESLKPGEITLEHRLQQEMLHQSKAARILVPDVSAVLGHICVMIHFEKLQEPADAEQPKKQPYAEMLKKQQHDVVQKMVENAGFTFSSQSIRKACANIEIESKALRARFFT